MAQRGGKDLHSFKNLPRTPVGSYLRKAVDPKSPTAPVPPGSPPPVLERFPELRLYNPRAWSDWIRSYVKNRLGRRHKFNFYLPGKADRGIYPLKSADGGERVRMALTGDWGSGTDEARRVGRQMAERHPDFTIHLGDVYYVGSLAEVNEHFLGVDNPHNDYTPCTWPAGRVGSFALNGNHEMYALGDAYFELLLPQMGMHSPRRRQQASFFCLENDDWRVIALDTGYNSIGRPIIENILRPTGRLEDALVEWLRDDVKLGARGDHRGIVLLSHHQYLLGLRRVVLQARAAARRVHQAAGRLVLGARAPHDCLRRPFVWRRHHGARPMPRPRRDAGRSLQPRPSLAAPRVPAALRGQSSVSERRGHRCRLQRLRRDRLRGAGAAGRVTAISPARSCTARRSASIARAPCTSHDTRSRTSPAQQ